MRRLAGLLALTLMASPAFAHRERAASAPPPTGLAIPSLTHGQMAVIAANLAAIRALADAQFPTDPVMRRLQGYVNLQAFACLWGWAPGSLSDKASPFNECAHAYLAGARALLLHLRDRPEGDKRAVAALVAKIEREMLAQGASLVLCRYSDEPFNTAEIVGPHWREIPSHAPTMLAVAALAALAAAGPAAYLAARRRAEPS